MTIKRPKFSQIFAAHDDGRERAETAAIIWAQVAGEMGKSLTTARAGILERYCLLRTEFQHDYSSMTYEGMVTTGKNGGAMWNIRFSAALKLSEALTKLEDQLQISPRVAGDKPERPQSELPEAARKYLERSKGIN